MARLPPVSALDTSGGSAVTTPGAWGRVCAGGTVEHKRSRATQPRQIAYSSTASRGRQQHLSTEDLEAVLRTRKSAVNPVSPPWRMPMLSAISTSYNSLLASKQRAVYPPSSMDLLGQSETPKLRRRLTDSASEAGSQRARGHGPRCFTIARRDIGRYKRRGGSRCART